jgi:hypothetical protein
MGNWHISIRGIGSHHNGKDEDADRIAKRVVNELRAAGHTVDDASFTYGAYADAGAPDKPAEAEAAPADAKVSPAAQPM